MKIGRLIIKLKTENSRKTENFLGDLKIQPFFTSNGKIKFTLNEIEVGFSDLIKYQKCAKSRDLNSLVDK